MYNVIKRLILPIIVDHDPITPFNPSIELISDINTPQPHTSLLKTLRAASRKKVYRDYDGLSSAEALHRLKIVMVAAMSDSFYQKTHTIRMLPDSRASNQAPRVCAEIVRHIAPILLGGGDLLQSRFAYAVMMEHVVKPALLLDPEPDPQPWPWSWWWSSEPKMFTTHAWLSSLLTERLFFDEKAWSVPGSLVRPLRRYADEVRSRTDRSSLDVLVLGCEKSMSSSTLINDIELNILWKQLLNRLSTEAKDQVFSMCKQPTRPAYMQETVSELHVYKKNLLIK